MPAPAIVLDLVERFHQHLATYKQNSYNEEQLRIEFLNPMFRRWAGTWRTRRATPRPTRR
jgi:hypothetical protein